MQYSLGSNQIKARAKWRQFWPQGLGAAANYHKRRLPSIIDIIKSICYTDM